MRFGSLFSGVGGFDLGFERAGMECAWQAERDKFALQVLNTHWPNVRKYEDVRDVGRNAEPVDLICGGFPCQDLSVAGKRAGLAGERSGLWFEFSRIIGELAPAWVVIENVPGLLSSNGGRDFQVILDQMVQHGYSCAWRVLDSQWFGVAQRRRRVFIVGNLGDATAAAKVLFEPESRDWDSAPRREKGQSYSFSAGASPAAGSIGWQNEQSPTLKSASGSNSLNYQNSVAISLQLSAKDQRGRGWSEDDISYTINSGGGVGVVSKGNGEVFLTEKHMSLSASGGGQAGQGYPAALTKVGVRRLTPIECERLQGFPDGWTGEHSDTQRYKMMGNAVTVNVAEWIARRIVEVAV